MKKILLIVSLCLSLNFIACAVKPSIQEQETFIYNQLNNNTFIYTRDIDVYITFNDGKISGSTGLNNFIGMYKVQDNKLILNNVGMTRKAGSYEKMSLERELVLMLSSNPIIKVQNGHSLYLAGKYHFEK